MAARASLHIRKESSALGFHPNGCLVHTITWLLKHTHTHDTIAHHTSHNFFIQPKIILLSTYHLFHIHLNQSHSSPNGMKSKSSYCTQTWCWGAPVSEAKLPIDVNFFFSSITLKLCN